MPARHLRRPRTWWLRRTGALLAALALGAAAGAGTTVALDAAADDGDAEPGSATLRPIPGPISIAVAGELAPGPALDARLGGAADDLPGPFGGVLAAADLAVVGLSAAVLPDGGAGGADPSAVPAGALDELERAGVDVVSLASDRALDLGVDGLAATLEAIRDRRLAVVGIGADEEAAYAAARRSVGGHRVAVIAATQQLDADRIAADTATAGNGGVASAKRVDRLVAAVQAAEADADVVVVHLHWGEAGQRCPSTGQLELAAALVAAGADVVAGSGAGVVQGAGRLGEAVVAYGLGGLVADDAAESGVLRIEVGTDGVAGWDWVPGTVDGGVARPLDGAASADVTADLDARRDCARLGP